VLIGRVRRRCEKRRRGRGIIIHMSSMVIVIVETTIWKRMYGVFVGMTKEAGGLYDNL